MTIRELLEQRAQKLGAKTFLYFGDLEISYDELDRRATRLANGLQRLGVKRGDRVCVLTHNCPEFVVSFFGITKAGAIQVPVNFLFKADEIAYVVANAEAETIITSPKFREVVDSIRPSIPLVRNFILVADEPEVGWRTFAGVLDAPDAPPAARVGKDDDAGIIYTSGTTGRPKGVILTHGNYVANALQIAERAKMDEADRYLCILPLFHVNAQLVTTMAPLWAGGSMILMEGFSPKTFLPAIARYKATAFSAVPTVYAILNNLPDAGSYDLSSLRFCICGAAPMPVEVFQTFEKKYKAFILEGYGLSEATCGSTVNPLEGKRKIGSIGIPLEGQTIIIADEHDRELPRGQVGEILVRGDVVMKGYYKNPEATAETLRNGWLHTGDLGTVDEDGYFTIVGRKKEMIIRGGENIYPKEVEEVIYRHPAVAEAAVIGIPDPIWGEEVAAFIVPKEGATASADEIIAYCKKHLADYKCPRKVLLWKSFPKTATGKIQKNRILEQLESR